MLAPQFNIRSLLALTAMAAVVGLVAGFARQQAIWAQTIVFVLLVVGFSFLIYGLLFLIALLLSGGIASLISQVRQDQSPASGAVHSPFAEHRPPPQLMQPEDPV